MSVYNRHVEGIRLFKCFYSCQFTMRIEIQHLQVNVQPISPWVCKGLFTPNVNETESELSLKLLQVKVQSFILLCKGTFTPNINETESQISLKLLQVKVQSFILLCKGTFTRSITETESELSLKLLQVKYSRSYSCVKVRLHRTSTKPKAKLV